MYYLITNSDGSKDGPFTDDPTPRLATGQMVITLTDEEFAAYDTQRRATAARDAALAEARERRQARYRDEADPLFFKAQRGEASLDDWKAKVAQIREEIPNPE